MEQVSAFEVYSKLKVNDEKKKKHDDIGKIKSQNSKTKKRKNVDSAVSPKSSKRSKKDTGEKKKSPKHKKQNKISPNKEILQNGTGSEKKIEHVKQKPKKEDTPPEWKDDKTLNLDLESEENSIECGRKLISWIISPLSEKKFFKQNWETRPLHVARHCPTYYSTILSCEQIDRTIRDKSLYYGKNLDITSYRDGQRETHNPAGRAHAAQVWDFYNQGCSIRILNPQTFFKKIHSVNATLQEYFGCLVGANVYLTPAGTQGFAPHYDDIEAFVLQIEGKKMWKLYAPLTPADVLPRESSKNFKQDELGPPIMEVVLEAGDILYFPRGMIHQASALEDTHSLHITLSMYQKNSWADLLEKLLPAALSRAVEENSSFREGLPMHYLSHAGVVHCDTKSEQRTQFLNTIQELMKKLVEYAPIDAAVDQMGKQFMLDALPVVVGKNERARTVFGDGEVIKNGVVENIAEMQLDTKIRLLRYNAIRLVTEEDELRLYHSINNSREYHGEEPQYLVIEESAAPGIDFLIHNYPNYVAIEELPITSDEEKARLATELWEVGIIMTDEPIGEDLE